MPTMRRHVHVLRTLRPRGVRRMRPPPKEPPPLVPPSCVPQQRHLAVLPYPGHPSRSCVDRPGDLCDLLGARSLPAVRPGRWRNDRRVGRHDRCRPSPPPLQAQQRAPGYHPTLPRVLDQLHHDQPWQTLVHPRLLHQIPAAPGPTGHTMTSPTHSPPHVAHLWLSGHGAPPSDLPRARLRKYHRPATTMRRTLNAPTRRPRTRTPTPHPLRRSVGSHLEAGPSRAALVHTMRQHRGPHPRPHPAWNDRRRPDGAVPALQLQKERTGPGVPKRRESALTVADLFLRGVQPDPQHPKRSIYRRSFRYPGVVRW